MKACGFIGQFGINMSAHMEKILKQDLIEIAEEFDAIYVNFYGEFSNFVLKFLRKNINKRLKIIGVHGYNNIYSDSERKYLERLYDEVIKIEEFDMNKRTNQIILKNCLQVFFFVDEDRYSDETFALKEARQKAVSYKNYFKYIK